MDLGIKDNFYLVTGSTQGLGLSIAEHFLREGANVVLCGRRESALKRAIESLSSKYSSNTVVGVAVDLCNPCDVKRLVAYVKSTCAVLNGLVCNVGSGRSSPTLQETKQVWDKMFDVNFHTAINSIQGFLPLLTQSAREGALSTITIVNSICSLEDINAPASYVSAKASLLAYAKSISSKLAPMNVRVNSVSPGNMYFEGSTWDQKMRDNPESVMAMLEEDVAMSRLGDPDEIAKVIVFISSYASSFVCGSNWVVDGGQLRSVR